MEHNRKPNHIAFIMDGNRRWAKQHNKPALLGHTEGGKTLQSIARAVAHRGVPFLTAWALSTENVQNRTPSELRHLFRLFGTLIEHVADFHEFDARLLLIGDLSVVPQDVMDKLNQLVKQTAHNTSLTFTLAINYGGHNEITRAVQSMLTHSPNIAPQDISAQDIAKYLDTGRMGIPDVDLVVRTGGYQRLSGLLPWQTTYAELFFTDTLWPEFSESELDQALDWYAHQKRNIGA